VTLIDLTHKRLREAEFFLRSLTSDESEWMEQEPEAGDFYFSAFMSAARQVTFALERAGYKQWSKDWLAGRPSDDGELHKFFIDQRNKAQHEGAADLEEVTTADVSLAQFLHEMSRPGGPGGSTFMSSGTPGASQPTFTKSEFRFAGRSAHPVAEVCGRYLDLLKQLARDFERDHPGTAV
jgi:hypothetical protein